MILSRSKPAADTRLRAGKGSAKKSFPELEDFILKRDYVGALTMLEFVRHEGNTDVWVEVWTAWCQFHVGEYRRALDAYTRVRNRPDLELSVADNIFLDLAVCFFYLGMYKESEDAVKEAPKCALKTRLLFHLAHKLDDEESLMSSHAQLRDVPEDQLCLASVHYLRAHYQEAIDVYKKLLLDKRGKKISKDEEVDWIKLLANDRAYMALNVYVALCYYKLDYYDVSQEVLGVYLAQHPTSTIAGNLKACNVFRLYNGKAAENELKQISSEQHTFGQDLVKHNLVVFKNGEGALKVLPELVDVVPEARLNLAGYRLRNNSPLEARALLEPLQPTSPLHYILRAVIAVRIYNETNDEEQLKIAQDSYHLVGSSASECDTIPGRQCMASSFFLAGQFEEVLVYLNSIKSFFTNDDTFNFNYAQAKVASGLYREAQECLLSIQDEDIKNSYTYLACLCRCHIMNKEASLAWDICVKAAGTSDHFALLQLVANDSYRMGQFLVSAKAFHMLDRLDGCPEMWEGLRGAVCGAAQAAAAGIAEGDLRAALSLLRGHRHARADALLRPIVRWAQQNRIPEEQLKIAQDSYHLVGSSASECDTIPGRQCMASSFFLAGQFEEVLVYLNSIKSFFTNDDTFNFNYAQAKVASGLYREAQECLLSIQDEDIKNSYTYLACLCRCHIMNKEASLAWDICVKAAGTSDHFALLQLVANDSYRMGQFLVSAKAFHMLDRLDGCPEMWEGLRGAVCGAAQAAAAGIAEGDLRAALSLLRGHRHARADALLRPIVRWAQQNRIPV